MADGAPPALSRLLAPLQLRGRTLPSRVVLCAHLTNLAVDRLPSPAQTAYYAARAAGGAGLVITEEQSVDPADRPYEKVVDGTDPAVVARYREIAGAVHAHGALVVAQLNHNGGQGSSLHSRVPLLAPSPVADPLFGEVPRQATAADLAAVVAGFARVAGHARDGGLDGVELQASQSSLLRAFLSPRANRRTDGFGQDRDRLLLEVAAAVRAALGPDLLLGVRLAVHEPDGTTTADAVATAHRLAATGAVDWLSTTVGVATESLYLVEPSMATDHGYALPLAARIRTAGLPVIGVGRITTPEQAHAALEHCDLVGVVRGQVADPDFVGRARRGEPVRVCTGCNECAAGIGAGLPMRCPQLSGLSAPNGPVGSARLTGLSAPNGRRESPRLSGLSAPDGPGDGPARRVVVGRRGTGRAPGGRSGRGGRAPGDPAGGRGPARRAGQAGRLRPRPG